jgi:alcohol dehydrogenase/propanol-preferring alcohol dehydrogenase
MIPLRAITIQGSYVGNLQELKELLILVRNSRVPPIPITRVKFEKANEALDRLRAGQVIGRAVLIP